jgi:Putative adhesin
MPTFPTPGPITVRIQAGAGSIRLVATDRPDTDVQVRPRDASSGSDARAAEHTRVDFRDGKLVVSGAKRGVPHFAGGAVDIEVALPSRSRLHVSTAAAGVRAEGEFADVRFATGSGEVEIDTVVGKIKGATASGSVAVHAAEGSASVATASGDVTIGRLDGELKFRAASGSLFVDRLCGHVRSRTSSGSVRVAEAIRGGVSAGCSSGEVAVGVAEGTAVRLDILTGSGAVVSSLEPSDGPEPGDETFLLQVRSGPGDVDVHRAHPAHQTAGGDAT